jgi:hypothetical protein
MSNNGYTFPDYGQYCYIGFPEGSPSLSLPLEEDYYIHRTYGMWEYAFFWNAINNNISVNSALDQATMMMYTTNFGSSLLHNGFTAQWGGAPFPDSSMAVYGNGDIHLFQYVPEPAIVV